VGRNSVITGTKLIKRSVANKTKRKGIRGRTTDSMGVPLIPQETYRQMPTGGEIIPMPTFAAIRIPRCMGSIPNATPAGTRIGIKTMMGGKASMIMPRIKNTT
jgi:hypothetical protein